MMQNEWWAGFHLVEDDPENETAYVMKVVGVIDGRYVCTILDIDASFNAKRNEAYGLKHVSAKRIDDDACTLFSSLDAAFLEWGRKIERYRHIREERTKRKVDQAETA